MDNEKFKNLMLDKEFVKKIMEMQTPEEVQSAFKEEGVEISIGEIETLGTLINESIKKGRKPLDEQELENISGGSEFIKSLKTGIGTSSPLMPIKLIAAKNYSSPNTTILKILTMLRMVRL